MITSINVLSILNKSIVENYYIFEKHWVKNYTGISIK